MTEKRPGTPPSAHAMIGFRETLPGTQAPARRTGRPALEREFGTALIVLLAGYAFLGKGFAYLHIPVGFSLYVGEIVLGLGVLFALLHPGYFSRVWRPAPLTLLALFFGIGALHTVPYLRTSGIDAVRDAALYYYSLFALLVYGLVRDKRRLERIASAYGKIARYFIFWVPAAAVIFSLAYRAVPRAPGTEVPLLWFKGGDVAVHLAGAVCFAFLVSETLPRRGRQRCGLYWYLGALVAAAFVMGRAAYLSLACSLAAALTLGKRIRIWKPALAALLLLAVLLLASPRVLLPSGAEISAGSLAEMVQSIFIEVDSPEWEGPKRWRLVWWYVIVDETFFGPYFWEGRGFGVNLADEHGFQVVDQAGQQPLRSPHSSHMTVLARMGVPGFLLWVSVQVALAWRFFASWRLARSAGYTFLQGVLAWVICFWVASVLNSSFDVYLEGPQGGIWFWSVVGLGLAAAELAREEHASAKSTENTRALGDEAV